MPAGSEFHIEGAAQTWTWDWINPWLGWVELGWVRKVKGWMAWPWHRTYADLEPMPGLAL